MKIRFHPHALMRMKERGTTKEEVTKTILEGESFPAKFERIGFRRNFRFDEQWKNKTYETKQVEAYTVLENEDVVVITVITKYF